MQIYTGYISVKKGAGYKADCFSVCKLPYDKWIVLSYLNVSTTIYVSPNGIVLYCITNCLVLEYSNRK